MKYSLLLAFFLLPAACHAIPPPNEELKKNEQWVCTRWSWTGLPDNRIVKCLRWEKQMKPYILQSR